MTAKECANSGCSYEKDKGIIEYRFNEIDDNFKEVKADLKETREAVIRIEGHLVATQPPKPAPESPLERKPGAVSTFFKNNFTQLIVGFAILISSASVGFSCGDNKFSCDGHPEVVHELSEKVAEAPVE